MAPKTRASSAPADKPAAKAAAAAPKPTAVKRKASAPAAKDTPAKKIAVTPAKKEAKAAPAPKKAAEKKIAEKKETKPAAVEKKAAIVEKKVAEKKPVEKKVEKKIVEKKTVAAPASKMTPVKEQDQKNDNDDDEEEDEQLMDDRALLKDIDSSADEDSSDDENEEDRAAMKEDTFATMKDEISLNPKAAANLRKKLGSLGQPKDKSATGVVYLGRIPHGFYEDQMNAYFSQFGKVLRLRLSRNKKTGKSKHYAFIEFASQEVADIVADTMDNYLLFGHQLKCKALQPTQIHPAMFLGANKKFKAIPWQKISKEKHNAEKSAAQMKQVTKKLLKNESAKRAKLAELGIDYEFPGYKANIQEKPKHTKF
ncbi:MKI67 FHA domain-interacting nucleolar phosphoprotein [Linnemannia schmuckeri]|uniref:MKI67 FHA domain-interacting nucleolar phosphoprotein n=1 Tax=Linnemannia schmuckeri TaxID=64567 RepID=A0A9P5RV77_9FUNG|nr:MKI67 FHA domain-interacting nucleolar phosphoprotein [Linnemannia schmuckeri]